MLEKPSRNLEYASIKKIDSVFAFLYSLRVHRLHISQAAVAAHTSGVASSLYIAYI